jgi:ribokinase
LVVLDPAPAQDLSLLPLERIDILTPNKGELITLTGEHSVERAARKLLDLGIGRVVCKAGKEGSYLIENGYSHHFSAFTVAPLDTTAAGDAFNGALASALAGGSPLSKAIEWANAAGALTTVKKGAQPSLPMLEEVESFLSTFKKKG